MALMYYIYGMFKPAIAICCLATLAACSGSTPVSQPAPIVNALPPHTPFHINLPEDHASGYLWQLDKSFDPTAAEYVNSVWHGNEKGVIFNFESGDHGKTSLTFHSIKYKDTTETKVFLIDVK